MNGRGAIDPRPEPQPQPLCGASDRIGIERMAASGANERSIDHLLSLTWARGSAGILPRTARDCNTRGIHDAENTEPAWPELPRGEGQVPREPLL